MKNKNIIRLNNSSKKQVLFKKFEQIKKNKKKKYWTSNPVAYIKNRIGDRKINSYKTAYRINKKKRKHIIFYNNWEREHFIF